MQTRIRRRLAIGGGLLSVVIIAVACSGNGTTTKPADSAAPTGQGGSSPSAAASPSAPAVVDAGPVVWWVPGPDAIDGTSQAIAKQCSTDTGINVDMQMSPWDGYTTKITTAITSGQGPDIVEIGNTDAPTLANTGAFMTWGDTELAAVGGKDQFVGQSLTAYVPTGQQPPSLPFNAGQDDSRGTFVESKRKFFVNPRIVADFRHRQNHIFNINRFDARTLNSFFHYK